MVRISIHGDRCVEYKDLIFRYYPNKRIVRKKSSVRSSTKLLILINYCVLKTRVMFPPVTFDGLFLKDAIIQCIYNLLMARRSYLRDILSRGISAYLVNVSLPQLGIPKRLNVLPCNATFMIGISLLTKSTEGCSTRIPEYPHLSNLGSPV